MLSNREAIFISTPQAVDQMGSYRGYRNIQARVEGALPEKGTWQILERNGFTLRLLNLHHGRNRPVENLGFIIEIGDQRFLHVGDTEVTAADLAPFDWEEAAIDFFFVPYWFLLDDPRPNDIIAMVGAGTVIPMHVPPPDDPRGYMENSGGFEGTVTRIQSHYPAAAIFRDVMTTRTFEVRPDTESSNR
jgi:hypothetical protein